MKRLFGTVIIGLFAIILSACGSSGSGGTSSSTSIDSVSDVPSLDAQDYVYSLSSSASLSSKSYLGPKAYSSEPGSVGGFSRSACEAYTLQKQLIKRSKFPEVIKCYMSTIEEHAGTAITSDWTSLLISGLDEAGGGPDEAEDGTFLIRVRKNTTGMYDMDACFGGSLSTEMRGTLSSGGGCTVSVVDSGSWGSASLTIALSGDCSYENYTTATFTESFDDIEWGYGSASLVSYNDTDYNEVEGSFYGTWEQFENSGKVFAQFDASSGSAKHSVSGTYPAMVASNVFPSDYLSSGSAVDCVGASITASDYLCCEGPDGGNCSGENGGCYKVESGDSCTFTDTGTESYDITITDSSTLAHEFKITASDSSYYDVVSVRDLSDDPERPTINFSDSWNCDDSNATVLDITELIASAGSEAQSAIEACIALEQEEGNFEEDSLCQQTEDAQRETWNNQ